MFSKTHNILFSKPTKIFICTICTKSTQRRPSFLFKIVMYKLHKNIHKIEHSFICLFSNYNMYKLYIYDHYFTQKFICTFCTYFTLPDIIPIIRKINIIHNQVFFNSMCINDETLIHLSNKTICTNCTIFVHVAHTKFH